MLDLEPEVCHQVDLQDDKVNRHTPAGHKTDKDLEVVNTPRVLECHFYSS